MKKDEAVKDVLDLKLGAHIVAPVSVNILPENSPPLVNAQSRSFYFSLDENCYMYEL